MEVVAEGGQRDACRVGCLLREEEQGAVEGGVVGEEGFGCLAALLVGGCAPPAAGGGGGGGGPCLLLLLLGVVGRRVGVVAAAAAAAVVRVCDWGRG